MKSHRTTNILLALVFIALLANLALSLPRTQEVVAQQDTLSPAVAAARISENIAPDKLAAEIADGLKAVAEANKQIAAAIREHARSTEQVASSIERAGRETRTQQNNP